MVRGHDTEWMDESARQRLQNSRQSVERDEKLGPI
jgi:hypothetical protein